MKSRVVIERIPCHADARGFLVEPVPPDLIPAQRNVHVAFTKPGGTRGNHYHEHSTERLVVVGPALVRVREDGAGRDIPVPAGEALRLTIPPGVSHAVQNTGSEPMLLVAFTTLPHNPARPDLVRDVLIAG